MTLDMERCDGCNKIVLAASMKQIWVAAFAQMAHSMGVPAQRVASVDEFAQAMDEAMAATGPYLIDIDMEHFAPMEISVMPKQKAEVDLKGR